MPFLAHFSRLNPQITQAYKTVDAVGVMGKSPAASTNMRLSELANTLRRVAARQGAVALN